jgi:hypothetical protein
MFAIMRKVESTTWVVARILGANGGCGAFSLVLQREGGRYVSLKRPRHSGRD